MPTVDGWTAAQTPPDLNTRTARSYKYERAVSYFSEKPARLPLQHRQRPVERSDDRIESSCRT